MWEKDAEEFEKLLICFLPFSSTSSYFQTLKVGPKNVPLKLLWSMDIGVSWRKEEAGRGGWIATGFSSAFAKFNLFYFRHSGPGCVALCAFLGMLVLATNGGSFHDGPNELKTVPKTCLYLLPVTFGPLQSNIFRHLKSGARMQSEKCFDRGVSKRKEEAGRGG